MAYYDNHASVYSNRKPRRKDTEALEYFMNEIPKESELCDLGCGNGWASAELAENGYLVRAIVQDTLNIL